MLAEKIGVAFLCQFDLRPRHFGCVLVKGVGQDNDVPVTEEIQYPALRPFSSRSEIKAMVFACY